MIELLNVSVLMGNIATGKIHRQQVFATYLFTRLPLISNTELLLVYKLRFKQFRYKMRLHVL